MLCLSLSLSCTTSNLVLADFASVLPLASSAPSSALPVHCAWAAGAANSAATMKMFRRVKRTTLFLGVQIVRGPRILAAGYRVNEAQGVVSDASDNVYGRVRNRALRRTQDRWYSTFVPLWLT